MHLKSGMSFFLRTKSHHVTTHGDDESERTHISHTTKVLL
jgi:hypothetical protein